jgi:hypothetical protein
METWCVIMREALGWRWYCCDALGSLPLTESIGHFKTPELARQDFERFFKDYKAIMAHRHRTG